MATEKKDILMILKARIKEHKERYGRLTDLSEACGVKIDILRRILHRPEFNPTLKNVQALLDHFGIKVVDKRKRNGKTVN